MITAQRQAGLLKGGKPKRKGSAADPLAKPIPREELGVSKYMADMARKLSALPAEDFDAFVAESKSAIDRALGNTLRQRTKTADRAAREQTLGSNTRLFPAGKFGVL